MEGAGGVNAHQLTGDPDDDHNHGFVGDCENMKKQKCRNIKSNFQGQCSATGRLPAGPKS